MDDTAAPSSLASELALAEQRVRRGDLVGAAVAYERLGRRFPDDVRARSRAEDIRAQLSPAELDEVRRRAAVDAGEAVRPEPRLSPLEHAEALVNSGRLVEAVAAYERLLATDPSNGLLAERLEELRKSGAAAPSITTPSITTPSITTPVVPSAASTAPPASLSPSAPMAKTPTTLTPPTNPSEARSEEMPPAQPTPTPLPADPVEALTELLERIRSAPRRR